MRRDIAKEIDLMASRLNELDEGGGGGRYFSSFILYQNLAF